MDTTTQRRLWRSRWAAIGAAVAVTLGAGGLYTSFAATAPSNFVAVSPVRVLDTRLGGFGGSLTSDTPRNLDVTGTISTVGADGVTVTPGTVVPDGATAIVANVTAVNPATAGFVSVRPGTATGTPTTSSLNFSSAGVVVPNAVTVELPTAGDPAGQIQLYFKGLSGSATTDVLVDIVGYYTASRGSGISPWDTIPSGQSVTGEWLYDASTASLSSDNFSISLPAHAPVALTGANVNFAADVYPTTTDDDATCTGTLTAPTAPPGKVCVYTNGPPGNYTGVRGDASFALPAQAFTIHGLPVATGTDAFFYLSWAYTAP